MDSRQAGLFAFACSQLGVAAESAEWQAVAGDASSRRYFRLRHAGESWICADSPPATEKNEAFLAIRSQLESAGLPVPQLFAVDAEPGFLLLEDLGDRHLLDVLGASDPGADYRGALPLLLRLQGVDATPLPHYSRELLHEEFSRFGEWFCQRWLGVSEESVTGGPVGAMGDHLVSAALEQPQVFVFRDYQSRNLLLQADGSLGLIDFQDAVRGPLCYDLVSLLKDCYIRWPAEKVRQWALWFRQQLLARGHVAGESDREFLRWFDWVGLHRHIKVLGNFTRLALRDNKPGYLADIPLVLSYIEQALEGYPEFDEFRHWFQQELAPLIDRQDWSGRS